MLGPKSSATKMKSVGIYYPIGTGRIRLCESHSFGYQKKKRLTFWGKFPAPTALAKKSWRARAPYYAAFHVSMCGILYLRPRKRLSPLNLTPSHTPITLHFLLRCLDRGLKHVQVRGTCPVDKTVASFAAKRGGGTVIETSKLTGTGYGLGITLIGNRLGRGRGRISSMQRMANLLL